MNIPFGRRKRALSAARDRLFGLPSAAITMDIDLGLKPAGVAAVVFKPMSAGEFTRVASDIEQLLESVAAEAGSKIERQTDSFGYQWVIIRDEDLEDLVTAANLVASELSTRASRRSCSPPRSASKGRTAPCTGCTASRTDASGRSSRRAKARTATTRKSWS